MMPVIRADEVSKWYGDVIALNEVSFEISEGITGLLGPNGAGKSTLLHVLTGQLRPSQGSVKVLGEDPWHNASLLQHVGFVPETLALWDALTGAEHVRLAGRLAGVDANVEASLGQVGLEREAHQRRVGGYSRGMRQRLKIAMGLVHDPKLLVLDEPFTGLDPVGRHAMMKLLQRFPAEGTNVLFSSHVLHEVETLTRTILVLVNGRIVAEGDVHEIRSLMDRHPHQVRIVVDDARSLARALIAREDVQRVCVDDATGEVLVETTRPERFYGALQALLLEDAYEVEALTSPDDNLQSVFRYLTEGGLA